MEEKKLVRVGVGTIVFRDGKVLLGKRRGKTSPGTWCFPGGHLEFGETAQECAVRETREESGVEIANLRQVAFTTDFYPEEKSHYVTLFFAADWKSGEPLVTEPDKIGDWQWFAPSEFPSPLAVFMQNFLELKLDFSKL